MRNTLHYLPLAAVAFMSTAFAACPEASDLRNQYRQLSLEIAQIGFRITQLGLPVTDARVAQLLLQSASLSKQRDAVAAKLSVCEGR